MNGSEKNFNSERDRVTCADLLAAGFRERCQKVLPIQTSDKFTFGAFKRQNILKAHHGLFAIGAVSVWLNIAVRVATSKDASILKKILRHRCLIKFFGKVVYFAFKVLVLCYEPIVFLLELLQLFFELDKPLLEDGSTSMLVDEFLNEGEGIQAHNFSSANSIY